MRTPRFWRANGATWPARLLSPVSWFWRAGAVQRARRAPTERLAIPVICVGNVTAGGAGKTPTVHALVRWLRAHGQRPHILLRGHGGNLPRRGVVAVDPARHTVADVGDEALLHARIAPTFAAYDRAAGAREAACDADILIMDDGFQNPTVHKDLSLLVVDLGFGFGNGRIMPAGPLREPVDLALARAGGVIAIGNGPVPHMLHNIDVPLVRAQIVPAPAAMTLAGQRVLPVTGIGRPEKFVETLREMRCDIAGLLAFPDHHIFTDAELVDAVARAEGAGAIPVMTAKDHVRLPADSRDLFRTVDIHLEFRYSDDLDILLQPLLRTG